MLDGGPLTAKEVQRHTGRSREHTARLMMKLYEAGLVDRIEFKRPFEYGITSEGRSLLGSKR